MNTVLDIKDIRKSFAVGFGSRGRAFGAEHKNVIDGLSVSLEQGKVSSLVGGNGVGKTTLFNLISGLLRPDAGSITFQHGDHVMDCTRAAPWKIARAGVGRMFQGTRVFGELSVMDHLLIQARPAGDEAPFHRLLHPLSDRSTNKDMLERIYNALKDFDEFRELWADGMKPASALSFARQRILSMAGLLLGEYDLLLLDEPSSGLNQESFDTMYRFLDMMRRQDKTVFLIEHNMQFIHQAADRCHYMAEGKIRFTGTPEDVLDHPEVKQSYLL